MLTPQTISATTPQKHKDSRDKDLIRLMVNTMVIGTVKSIGDGLATIEIFNKKALDCQIYKNAPGNNADITAYYFQPLGSITVRYICLAYLYATPQVNDMVTAFVPQSSIEGYFDNSGNDYGGDYPIAEALVLPIKTGYTDSNKLIINPNSDTITEVDLKATTGNITVTNLTFNDTTCHINTDGMKISGHGGEIFHNMATMLTAVGNVGIPGGTIDSASGGAITNFVNFLDLFNA